MKITVDHAVLALADELDREAIASENVAANLQNGGYLDILEARKHVQHSTIARNHARRIREAQAATRVELDAPETLQKVAEAIWKQAFMDEFHSLPLIPCTVPPTVIPLAQAVIEALK